MNSIHKWRLHKPPPLVVPKSSRITVEPTNEWEMGMFLYSFSKKLDNSFAKFTYRMQRDILQSSVIKNESINVNEFIDSLGKQIAEINFIEENDKREEDLKEVVSSIGNIIDEGKCEIVESLKKAKENKRLAKERKINSMKELDHSIKNANSAISTASLEFAVESSKVKNFFASKKKANREEKISFRRKQERLHIKAEQLDGYRSMIKSNEELIGNSISRTFDSIMEIDVSEPKNTTKHLIKREIDLIKSGRRSQDNVKCQSIGRILEDLDNINQSLKEEIADAKSFDQLNENTQENGIHQFREPITIEKKRVFPTRRLTTRIKMY